MCCLSSSISSAAGEGAAASRAADVFPSVALRLSTALQNFNSDATARKLGEAIGTAKLIPLLQHSGLHHLVPPSATREGSKKVETRG